MVSVVVVVVVGDEEDMDENGAGKVGSAPPTACRSI